MRYIHISTPVFHRAGVTYRRLRQKFPSKTMRKRVGNGTYQRNRWGSEWYVKQRSQEKATRLYQLTAIQRKLYEWEERS